MTPDHLEPRPEAVLDPERFEGDAWADALWDEPKRTTSGTDLTGLRKI